MPYNVVDANRRAVATGTALGAQMFENSLRMQQLKSQEALRRLQEQQVAQQMAMQLWQHNQLVDEQADRAKAAAAMQADLTLHPPVVALPQAGPPQAGEGSLPNVTVPNPEGILPEDAYMKHMLPVDIKWQGARPGARGALDVLADYARIKKERASVGAGGQPAVGSVTLPDGRNVSYAQESNGSVRYFPPDTFAEHQKAIAERQLTVSQLKSLMNAPGGMDLVKQDPQTGAFVPDWSKGEEIRKALAVGSGITTATRTALEKQQTEVAKVFVLGQQLAPLLTQANSGFVGNTTRLFEGIASQLIPGYKIGTATDAATVATEFQSALVRGMKSDSNIAEPERESLKKAMPSVTDYTRGAPQAKATLATVLEQWGRLSRNNAAILNKPIFPQFLTRDEIRGKLAKGEINVEQADALMESNGWELINKLRSEALR